jgi:D-aminoacyl-tRNA deacylase
VSGTRIGVVVSEADEASEHVGEHLLDGADWTTSEDGGRPPADGGGTVHESGPFELRTFEALHLHLDGVAVAFDDPDLVVFASRHSGETGPLLTAHFTGNLGPAEYGGADRSLAAAAPAALDRVLAGFAAHAPAAYDVGVECTHHGPSDVGAPSLFVELGSGPDEWADAAAAAAVADSIRGLAGLTAPAGERTLVGVGGGHYAKRFERVARETGWSVGHVAADWGLEALGDPREHPDVVAQVFEESGAERALFDGEHPDLAAVVDALGYDVVTETWVRAVDGVDMDLVTDLEADLSPVDDGLRFGDPAREYAGDHGTVGLPDDLLGAARAVDRDRTRAAVESHLLAFETEEGASVAAGRGAVASSEAMEALVGDLVGLLSEKYDRVERDGDRVVAHERGLDPERARELGVPAGPKFGQLAGGTAVEVDGRTVEPDDVLVDRTHEFPLGGVGEDYSTT